jgi:subtilisin family serine protease
VEPITQVVAGVPVLNYQNRYFTAEDGLAEESAHEPVTDWILIMKNANVTDVVLHSICNAEGQCLAVGHPSSGGVAFVIIQSTDSELDAVLRTYGEHVEYVEPDAPMQLIPDVVENETMDALNNVASWGLDRVDDRKGMDGTYTGAVNGGGGVHVYVADTGIRTTHQTFGGRASPAVDLTSGNLIECNVCDLDCALDRHGHGTHCAGTIGGDEFGVARGVTLHAVKVLSDSGSGSWAWFVKALDWVAVHGQRPAVLSASLGGQGQQSSVGKAVEAATKAGVTVVVAAGNSRGDACNYSPAYAPSALTIGATDSADARADFSNYGKCLDLFAPGVQITSAWSGGDSRTKTISGTSMACPHVAGAAALLLQVDPQATPSQIASTLRSQATNGVVSDPRDGSPNLLLYVNTSVTPPPQTTAKPVSTTSSLCTTTTTTTTTTTSRPLSPASGFCGFEDSNDLLCGIWRQNSFDQFDWTQKSGKTPSSGTGPDKAHGGGWYLYTEVSSPRRSGDEAILEALTPTLQLVFLGF